MRQRTLSLLFSLFMLWGITSSAQSATQNTVLAQFYLRPQTGWSIWCDARYRVWVRRTKDGGIHWKEAVVPAQMETASAFVQFVDEKNGFLLLLSEPATGMMDKVVCRSSDSGQSWHIVADSRTAKATIPYAAFYPDGLTFRNSTQGWMGGEPRGTVRFPLLQTRDGGRTWRFQAFPIPLEFRKAGYANTKAPVFFGQNQTEGILPVELHLNKGKDELSKLVLYATHDGGQSWTLTHFNR